MQVLLVSRGVHAQQVESVSTRRGSCEVRDTPRTGIWYSVVCDCAILHQFPADEHHDTGIAMAACHVVVGIGALYVGGHPDLGSVALGFCEDHERGLRVFLVYGCHIILYRVAASDVQCQDLHPCCVGVHVLGGEWVGVC